MRTGRPRGFCVEETLDRAMTVFWRHGYEGASLSDLTSAMGINSPSLYACFGSKEGLFRAVLERYDERRKSFMESVLAAPTAAKAAELYLHGVADFAIDTSGQNPPGCLLLQSGLSCGDSDIVRSLRESPQTGRSAEKRQSRGPRPLFDDGLQRRLRPGGVGRIGRRTA